MRESIDGEMSAMRGAMAALKRRCEAAESEAANTMAQLGRLQAERDRALEAAQHERSQLTLMADKARAELEVSASATERKLQLAVAQLDHNASEMHALASEAQREAAAAAQAQAEARAAHQHARQSEELERANARAEAERGKLLEQNAQLRAKVEELSNRLVDSEQSWRMRGAHADLALRHAQNESVAMRKQVAELSSGNNSHGASWTPHRRPTFKPAPAAAPPVPPPASSPHHVGDADWLLFTSPGAGAPQSYFAWQGAGETPPPRAVHSRGGPSSARASANGSVATPTSRRSRGAYQ